MFDHIAALVLAFVALLALAALAAPTITVGLPEEHIMGRLLLTCVLFSRFDVFEPETHAAQIYGDPVRYRPNPLHFRWFTLPFLELSWSFGA